MAEIAQYSFDSVDFYCTVLLTIIAVLNTLHVVNFTHISVKVCESSCGISMKVLSLLSVYQIVLYYSILYCTILFYIMLYM